MGESLAKAEAQSLVPKERSGRRLCKCGSYSFLPARPLATWPGNRRLNRPPYTPGLYLFVLGYRKDVCGALVTAIQNVACLLQLRAGIAFSGSVCSWTEHSPRLNLERRRGEKREGDREGTIFGATGTPYQQPCSADLALACRRRRPSSRSKATRGVPSGKSCISSLGKLSAGERAGLSGAEGRLGRRLLYNPPTTGTPLRRRCDKRHVRSFVCSCQKGGHNSPE